MLFAVSLLKPSPVNASLLIPTLPDPPASFIEPITFNGNTYTYPIFFGTRRISDNYGTLNMCKPNPSATFLSYNLSWVTDHFQSNPSVIDGYGSSCIRTAFYTSADGWYTTAPSTSVGVLNLFGVDSVYYLPICANQIGSVFKSTLPVNIFNTGSSNITVNQTGCDSMTFLANSRTPANLASLWDTSPEPVPTSNYQYYMEYKNNYALTGYHRVEFNGDMVISSSYAVGANLLGFDSDWELYYINGTVKTLLDDSSSDYPPYLQITDTNNPCANILRSNYVLIDDLGTAICMATVNPIIENIAPPYTGLINFDPTAQDWGAFEWFEDVVVWFTDIINDVVGWFYGLWTNLLNLIIPTPDIFAFFAQDIKVAFQEHFPTELIATLTDVFDDMENMSDDEIPVIQGSLMGVNVNFVDFSLIDSSMYIIRPILTGMLIFIIIITYIKLFQLYFAKN